MESDRNRRNGEIFPDLRRETTENPHDPKSAGWDDHVGQQPPVRTFRRQPSPQHSGGASTGPLWLALTILLVVLTGAVVYGYRTLQEGNIQLSQVPAMLKSMGNVNARLGDMEEKLQSWASDWQNLADRLAKVEKTVNVDFQRARKHSEVLTTQLEERIEDRLDGRNYVVDTRLDQIESEHKLAQAKVEDLSRELVTARREIASLRGETNGDLSILHQHLAGSDQQLHALARQIEHDRVDFELSKNRPAELSSGISMNLTATDVRYQRFSGWVYFQPDRRFLWVRDHGVQQPVVFYDEKETQRYEVVVSMIRNDSATGYVLLPVESSSATGTVTSAARGQ